MSADVESMVFVEDRGLPWWVGGVEDHGQWQAADGLMTLEDALARGGLADWNVQFQTLYAGRKGQAITDRRAVVRGTDGKPLGITSPRYTILQNEEAFGFGRAILDEGDARIDTAGSLKGGRVTFVAFEMTGMEIKVGGADIDETVKTYLVVANSFDGSLPLTGKISQVRVVCSNTCEAAIRGTGPTFRIKHAGVLDGKLAAAREALTITFGYHLKFAETATELMSKELIDEQVLDIFRRVWPVDVDAKTEAQLERHASSLAYENYLTSENLDAIRGTAWGAYNAVTEYVDHIAVARGSKATTAQDRRSWNLMFGNEGSTPKEAALKLLLKA